MENQEIRGGYMGFYAQYQEQHTQIHINEMVTNLKDPIFSKGIRTKATILLLQYY